MEKTAAVPSGERLAERADITRAVHAATQEASRGRPSTRRAPRIPVAILAALERYVLNDQRPSYLRGVAWARLVKMWVTLRYDDLSWSSPLRLHLHEGTLAATLVRAKTSG
eukprot:12559580-Alexandrium_andersonii.AAC.1